MTTLADEYERVCRTPSDIWLHLPRFVEMVRRLDAQHVVELGTRSGVSTVAWLHGLSQTGGRLTSVDIDVRPDIGEFEHWSFVQGSDLDPAVIDQLDECDICFVDTSHLYDHTCAELRIYRHLVRPGGLLVCHDTMLERPEGAPARPKFPVARAVEEFCAEEGLAWRNIPECWGLGIIQL